jgi:hypothetical protein
VGAKEKKEGIGGGCQKKMARLGTIYVFLLTYVDFLVIMYGHAFIQESPPTINSMKWKGTPLASEKKNIVKKKGFLKGTVVYRRAPRISCMMVQEVSPLH